MNQLLKNYAIAVNHPDVSGFEHLEMLMVRDKLATIEPMLPPTERRQLAEADQRLVERADDFYAELNRITDLAYEREHRRVPSSHWWWYLDVLIHAPSFTGHYPKPVPVPA